MGVLEIIVLAAKFLFTELPKLIQNYKLYRKDMNYKNKQLAYEEALIDYKKADQSNDTMAKLKKLREIGKAKVK